MTKALDWYYGHLPLLAYPECGWDFDLWESIDTLKRGRWVSVVPFQWARREGKPGIWDRLSLRRAALAAREPAAGIATERSARQAPEAGQVSSVWRSVGVGVPSDTEGMSEEDVVFSGPALVPPPPARPTPVCEESDLVTFFTCGETVVAYRAADCVGVYRAAD